MILCGALLFRPYLINQSQRNTDLKWFTTNKCEVSSSCVAEKGSDSRTAITMISLLGNSLHLCPQSRSFITLIQNLRQKRSTTWRKTSESWDAGLSKREKRALCTFRALNWKEAFSKDAPTSSSSSAELFEGICLIEKALFLLELNN